MNVKEYISSGILESYVLGSCTAAEQKEVEANAMQYPEVKEELENIREALNAYAMANEITPPAFLKDRIANAVKTNANANLKTEAKIIPLQNESRSNTGVYKFLAAASVALLILCGTMLYRTMNEQNKLSEQYSLVMNENSKLNDSIQTQNKNYEIEKIKMEIKLAQLDMVKKPSMVAMPMKGKDIAPDAKVCVYGDSKTNEIFLEVNKLPKAPTGMQYQLWAIVKGKPVNAGMIQVCEQPDPDSYRDCGILKMNSVADAHAFAISLEKEGGVDSPKGDIFATFGL